MEPEFDFEQSLVDFSCCLCGECCSRYQVRLSISEAKCISEKLGLEWEKFRDCYTDAKWPGGSSLLLRHQDGACVFLKRTAGERTAVCSIHDFKPESCIQWTPGLYRKECRDGLRRCWKLKVGEDGRLIGTKEDIKRYKKFKSSYDSAKTEPQE